MSDSFLGQTILRKPTIIQTVRNERVVISSLPAPRQSELAIRGLGPSWRPVFGQGPVESFEYDETVWLFTQSLNQSLVLWVKVPSLYRTGRPIFLRQGQYSAGFAANTKLQASTALVRKNVDAITTTANLHLSVNGDNPLSAPNLYQELVYDLTDSSGNINSLAVSPNDLLKIKLTRVTPAGVDDFSNLRMIPSSSEILF